MKINNNTLYKIFFYLLITIFIVFIITNTLIEHYDDTNICTAAIKKLTPTQLTDDDQQDDVPQGDHSQDDQPQGDQSQDDQPQGDQSQDTPKDDITVYNTNLYKSKDYLNNIGKQMVNYIELKSTDENIIFKKIYPDAYKAYIEAKKKNPNLDTFVYVPM